MYFNTQSQYSLLQSTLKIEQYVQRAKAEGCSYLGLADINTLMGTVDFYEQCQKANLKPLVGMTLRTEGWKDSNKKYDLLLFAKNFQGYQQLIHLCRLVNKNDPDSEEIWAYLEQTALDLIVITPGYQGQIEQAIMNQDDKVADQLVQDFRHIFGHENIYLGLPAYPFSQRDSQVLINYSTTQKLPIVSNQKINVLDRSQAFSLKVLDAIHHNQTLDIQMIDMDYYQFFYSKQELLDAYDLLGISDMEVICQNLAQQIDLWIPLNQAYLPKFKLAENWTAPAYLSYLCQRGLEEKGLSEITEYVQRLDHELAIIQQMGFSDYFLIVWEIMTFCHQEGIRTGPGRGSVAGSLVAYLLDITTVDPLPYDLLFERFLNPDRLSMPDIDFDLPDDKRDKVIKHIMEIYGEENIGQISTLGTFGAKQAMRDTLRVMGASKEVLKTWSSAIPSETGITLTQALQQSRRLRDLVNFKDENKKIFQIALSIEGLPRHISTHAAGLIIHDQPLDEIVPVVDRPGAPLLSQFNMHHLEKIGLLKLDLLSIRNLSFLDELVATIKLTKQVDLDVSKIALDDGETLKLFRKGMTNGIFQFESEGMKSVLKRLKPTHFNDLVAVIALFRPGPMKQIDDYIKGRNQPKIVTYLHPKLEGILKKTFGVIIYQEQVMQIVQQMAGFTLAQADLFRRAIGKKQADVLESERNHFIQGCQDNGIDLGIANKVFQLINAFAQYGFNKSHAVVYATLAFQLAYIKAHYPLQYYVCLLNQGGSNTQPLKAYIEEVKHGFGTILSVDINRSLASFTIDGQGIRVGFDSIKGLRRDLVAYVIQDRAQYGDYENFQDFVNRLPKKWVTNDILEAFIVTGAFDRLGHNRATLYYNLPNFIQAAEFSGMSMNLLEAISPKIDEKDEWESAKLQELEESYLGFTTQAHPLYAYQNLINQLDDLSNLENYPLRKRIKGIAYLVDYRQIETKKGDPMVFLTFDTGIKKIPAVVFPENFLRYQAVLSRRGVVYIEGSVGEDKQKERQIVLDKIEKVNPQTSQEIRQQVMSKCFIRLHSDKQTDNLLAFFQTLAADYPGPCQIIVVDDHRNIHALSHDLSIGYGQAVQDQLGRKFGKENVVFQ